MDASKFDAVTERLSGLLSRRRSLGALAALGLGVGFHIDDATAKRKKKKKKKNGSKDNPPPSSPCSDCSPCETCVNDVCQPITDLTACGADHVCLHGACARQCTVLGPECGASASCTTAMQPFTSMCGMNDAALCSQPDCTSSADCPRGRVCALWSCPGSIGAATAICVRVAQI